MSHFALSAYNSIKTYFIHALSRLVFSQHCTCSLFHNLCKNIYCILVVNFSETVEIAVHFFQINYRSFRFVVVQVVGVFPFILFR